MYGRIYCMLNSSIPLTKGMSVELFQVARKMLKERSGREGFLTAEMGGVVTTSFKESAVGQISGVVFFAEIESDSGRGRVVYLVNPTDVIDEKEGLEWINLKEYLRQVHTKTTLN